MAAGMGGHAVMMRASKRYGKHKVGKITRSAAGLERALFTYPLQPFDIEITTANSMGTETAGLRADCSSPGRKLNLWRREAVSSFPFLRLATVEGRR